MTLTARIAIATYSVRPRGGAVHSVELAEALAAEGVDVTLIALGDPAEGFFRPTSVPVHIVEAPARAGTLTERVFSHIDALESGLGADLADRFDIVHTRTASRPEPRPGFATAEPGSDCSVRCTTSTTSPPRR